MQFGDKEWFELLGKRAKFPGVFAFYIGSDKRVSTTVIKTNSKNIGNIQYKTVKTFYSDSALASVLRCETPNDYYKECKRIMDAWGIEPEATDTTESA